MPFGVITVPAGTTIDWSLPVSQTIFPSGSSTRPPVGTVTLPNWSTCGACPFAPGLTNTSSAVPNWPSCPAILADPSVSIDTWLCTIVLFSWINKVSSLTSAKDVVNPILLIVIAPVNTKTLVFFSCFPPFFYNIRLIFLNFSNKL